MGGGGRVLSSLIEERTTVDATMDAALEEHEQIGLSLFHVNQVFAPSSFFLTFLHHRGSIP